MVSTLYTLYLYLLNIYSISTLYLAWLWTCSAGSGTDTGDAVVDLTMASLLRIYILGFYIKLFSNVMCEVRNKPLSPKISYYAFSRSMIQPC